jgi:hypothetical protein
MKKQLCNAISFVLLMGLGGASCVSRHEGIPGVKADIEAQVNLEEEMKSPLMFKEAGLPKGFPPPGPVGEVIYKEYPAYREARTTASSGGKNASNSMFWPLFQHIKKNDIAMTAPVEMTYKNEASTRKDQPETMAFLYGDPQWGKISQDGTVEVVDQPALNVLSVTLRGGYEKSFEKGIGQLREWMEANPGRYEVTGPPRFFGYNSPLVPWFLQVGEVQLPVKTLGGSDVAESR